jgi:hypothetical protein
MDEEGCFHVDSMSEEKPQGTPVLNRRDEVCGVVAVDHSYMLKKGDWVGTVTQTAYELEDERWF